MSEMQCRNCGRYKVLREVRGTHTAETIDSLCYDARGLERDDSIVRRGTAVYEICGPERDDSIVRRGTAVYEICGLERDDSIV